MAWFHPHHRLGEDDLKDVHAHENEVAESSNNVAVLPRELQRRQLKLGSLLGKGQFGSVLQASMNDEAADLVSTYAPRYQWFNFASHSFLFFSSLSSFFSFFLLKYAATRMT